MPVIGNPDNETLLASAGTGIRYDISQWDLFDRWRPQSDFLQNLELSLRVPFYMNDLQGHDDLKPRFIFGITESF